MTDSGTKRDEELSLKRAARRQERRRRVREARFDTSVPSPCISVCQLDDATGLCLGCRRDIDEIRDWPIMTAEEKRAVLQRVEQRGGADGDGGGR